MVKTWHIAAIVVAVAAAVAACVLFWPNEARKVRKQFNSLSVAVLKDSDEKILQIAIQAQKTARLFDKTAAFNVPVSMLSGTYTPAEVANRAAAARSMFSTVSLKFSDLKIDFQGEDLSRVTLTACLKGRLTDGENVDETREMECVLRKVEKKWLFSELTVVEALRK